MKKQLALGLAAAMCTLGGSALAGGEHGAEKPQMYVIYKEVVKPSLTEQYEQGIQFMVSEFEQYQIDPEKISWKAVSGPELGYVYVMKLENWAGMDTMHENWMAAMETIGKDKFEAMMAPVHEAMESIDVFTVVHREDLSYTPEQPRLKPEEVEYVHYGFYYGIPGKNEQLEAIAREFAELYKRKGIDSGWRVYQNTTGTDLPLLVVAHGAKSEADFYANREKIKKILGEEGKKLGEKVHTAVRKIDYKEGHLRPDLAYPNPAHAEK